MKNVSCSCLQHCQSILETLMKPLPGLVPVMQTEHEMSYATASRKTQANPSNNSRLGIPRNYFYTLVQH